MTEHKPVAIRTLGDVLASQGYTLWANCGRCVRSVKLDPQELAATYGADLKIAQLKRRLKCAQCGRRTSSVTLGFDMGPGKG
jgi:hypothetical protein